MKPVFVRCSLCVLAWVAIATGAAMATYVALALLKGEVHLSSPSGEALASVATAPTSFWIGVAIYVSGSLLFFWIGSGLIGRCRKS